ncbi:WYL domain-containing protein [Roseibacillus persicicus]|uniref:WYL domain-containing protein n=1 Tax=Roseibacillus persicicus TaxID=454148 RepID=UPI00398BA56A
MGNRTSEENWASRERLRWIEVLLWWRGWVGRADLGDVFGISAAQASSDLQRYLKINPGAMVYRTDRKRYEGTPAMRCKLHEPNLEEGLSLLGGGFPDVRRVVTNGDDEGRVSVVELPRRGANPKVCRAIVLAAGSSLSVGIRYHSLNAESDKKRNILPRGFGWDGRRWHTRAWDVEKEQWRDYVLGRIESADWPTESPLSPLPNDDDWTTWEVIRLRLNPSLSADAKEALRRDYGLAGELLELRVRRAMRTYLLAELHLKDGLQKNLPSHFILDDD